MLIAHLLDIAAGPKPATGSRQEFRRVFGTSPRPPRPPTAQIQAIEPFRQSLTVPGLQTFVDSKSTPASINSTSLLELLNGPEPRRYFLLWHLIALDLTAIDHRVTIADSPNTYQEQFGPARTARALALIHQAMFEAQNAFDRKYETTLPGPQIVPKPGASVEVALTEAAYQLMTWLYPGLNDQELPDPTRAAMGAAAAQTLPCISPSFSLSRYYRCALDKANSSKEAREEGIHVGRAIAGRIIAERVHDGADRPDPVWRNDFRPRHTPSDTDYNYLQWQRDPVSGLDTALGGYWANVKPFALSSAFQFRPDVDPTRDFFVNPDKTAEKTSIKSYDAVRKWGRDARLNDVSVDPPPDIGLYLAQFWAYDGTANLCAPARLYNQIALAALAHLELKPEDGYNAIDVKSPVELARFFALINMALADSSISAWDAKYHFQYPRPVTYIRAVEEAKATEAAMKPRAPAPTGTGSNDDADRIAPKWLPVGAQVTNAEQPRNITPPFPSYPSGHAVFGGALFGMLRQFVKPEAEFEFRSDEFNGKNRDVFNYVRCDEPRSPNDKTPSLFCGKRKLTLDCAERENADSRIFMGVHWIFDADDGITMGNEIARQVYRKQMSGMTTASPRSGMPTPQLFSASDKKPGSEAKRMRDDLLCPGVALPKGLDAAANFGPLEIKTVRLD